MNFLRRYSCFVLPATLLAVSACDSSVPRAAPPPPKVNVAHPTIRDVVDYDEYNGWIDATESVDVRARVRGHIQKISFTDGQIVKKGQLLFELDPRPFEANVGRANDQLHVSEAQLVAAQKEQARLKDLLTKGGASQSQVDKTEADALSLAAEVEADKHEIVRQELDLEYSKITAPIDGRVGRAQLTEGNLVNAGGSDPVLTTIVSVDPVDIYFAVDERAMQRYMARDKGNATRSGAMKGSKLPFFFALETEQGFPHEGMLDFVDNQVDKQTGTILVRGSIPNPQLLFVAGSRVKIRVPVSDSRPVTLVPDSAVLSDQDKKYLLVVDDKNIVQRRDFSPGRLLDGGMRAILENENGPVVTPAEWIIVQGIQSARINYPVDPIRLDSQSTPASPASKPTAASEPAATAQ